jgi:hypothetical protein
MPGAIDQNLFITAALIVPSIVALIHLSTFPYIRSTAIPAWFLVIAALPVIGPLAWAWHARSRTAHARRLIEELTLPR